jgi:hypothetical protein
MPERKTITLPIKCSTVNCAYEVLSEMILVIGILLPFIGAAMCAASWYIFTYTDPIKTEMTYLGPAVYYNDMGFYLGCFGLFFLIVGFATFPMILSIRYKITCIKDED